MGEYTDIDDDCESPLTLPRERNVHAVLNDVCRYWVAQYR